MGEDGRGKNKYVGRKCSIIEYETVLIMLKEIYYKNKKMREKKKVLCIMEK